ncbi:MAG TPA: TetR/AcrR family transcriptional regulator [Marmoricola sp.]|nr:TetR/AcrR family transcriptional regulator [Marmoricola sp.]
MAPPEITAITEGVFFTTPPALPRGRHTLERHAVASAQRERIMIAMTELMAAQGFNAVTITDIAARAAVSRAAFYNVFPDKEACALAAYERFIQVLLTEVSSALAKPEPFDVALKAVITSYLRALESDPVVGRAFQVEMDAVGPQARQWRRDSLDLFARALSQRYHAESREQDLDESAFLGGVYAVRQIASDALDTRERPKLTESAPVLTNWIKRIYAE